ncbi:hypothetical protein ACX2QB_08705 [Weissella viridescens]
MAIDNMENWFDGMDADTKEPNAFGFDDGTTDAVLTDVSLFESKNSSWTAVQMEFTDVDGNEDNGYRVSVSRKKTDGTKIPTKMWQRNVFQLMQPLILSDKNYKPALDLETIKQGNAAVVEAMQVLVGKMKVRVEKNSPDEEDGFAEYKFLKVEEEIETPDDGFAF